MCMTGFSRRALEVFSRLPRDQPVEVSELLEDESRPTILRHVRRLEEAGLVATVQQRPKVVKLAPEPFASLLHGLLTSKPHLSDILTGSNLLVLASIGTSDHPRTSDEIATVTGLHENTVRKSIRELQRRALVDRSRTGIALADHVPELHHLSSAYRDHFVENILREHPHVFPVAAEGLRVLFEAEAPSDGLQPTGAYRFQLEGADVLAARPQYAATPGEAEVTLLDAYRDARRLGTPSRTLAEMKKILPDARDPGG